MPFPGRCPGLTEVGPTGRPLAEHIQKRPNGAKAVRPGQSDRKGAPPWGNNSKNKKRPNGAKAVRPGQSDRKGAPPWDHKGNYNENAL